MTITYGGYDIAAMAAKYGDTVSPRIVEGPNPLDSIAGTHELDDLAYKEDLIVQLRPISDAQLVTLRSLMADRLSTPYKALQYVNGAVTISGQYSIFVSPATSTMRTSERKLYDGVVVTFTQR